VVLHVIQIPGMVSRLMFKEWKWQSISNKFKYQFLLLLGTRTETFQSRKVNKLLMAFQVQNSAKLKVAGIYSASIKIGQ
jgi:hypothetical protein